MLSGCRIECPQTSAFQSQQSVGAQKWSIIKFGGPNLRSISRNLNLPLSFRYWLGLSGQCFLVCIITDVGPGCTHTCSEGFVYVPRDCLGVLLGLKEFFDIGFIHDSRCLLRSPPLLESYLTGCMNKRETLDSRMDCEPFWNDKMFVSCLYHCWVTRSFLVQHFPTQGWTWGHLAGSDHSPKDIILE